MNPKQPPKPPLLLLTLFLTLLLLLALPAACATANPGPTAADRLANGSLNPGLAATAQADQYWRDAQATTVSQQATQEANYRNVQGTAVAAQVTSAAEQTRDALSFSMTVAAATAQAQETAVSATRSVEATSTAQAHADAVATVTQAAAIAQATRTAQAEATAAALVATRQAWELEQVRREQLISNLGTAFMGLLAVIVTGLLLYLLWLLLPTLVSRAGLVRYGQHGNPLLLSQRNGRTVLTDPLRMLQAAVTIDDEGHVTMPDLVPESIQAMLAGGVLRTLIEQARHAPGHAPVLPSEVSHLRRLGPWTSQQTTRHDPGQTILPTLSALTGGSQAEAAEAQPDAGDDLLPLPDSIPWSLLAGHDGDGIALGVGRGPIAHGPRLITLDLARLPHLFVAGMSGAGKTRRLLRPLVAQVIADGYTAVLMNESGSDFSPFYSLPQAAIVRGDVYSYMAVLEAAMGEMTRREQLLRDLHVSEWQRMPDEFYLQHPFVLLAIDELLALAATLTPKEQKQFWAMLTAFASRARKVGMCSLGLATDPTYRALGQGGLNYRSQCGRISFRMFQASGSRAILDQNGAEQLEESQFLALLDKPGVQTGVAANPSDDELSRYLDRQTRQSGATGLTPRWLPASVSRQVATRLPIDRLSAGSSQATSQPANDRSSSQPFGPRSDPHGGPQSGPQSGPQPADNHRQPAGNRLQPVDNQSSTQQVGPQPPHNQSPTQQVGLQPPHNQLTTGCDTTGCDPTTTLFPQPQPVVQPVAASDAAAWPYSHPHGRNGGHNRDHNQSALSGPMATDQVSLPFPTNRPPTAAEADFIHQLHVDGLSRNAICRHVYGFKDGRTYGWVREAIDGSDN
jgi:hypothetical protein